MEFIRLVAAGLLALVCLVTVIGNIRIVLRYLFRNTHGSLVPVLGGLCGSLAMLASPWSPLTPWAWLPFALDPGALPLVVMAGVRYTRRRANRSAPEAKRRDAP